MNTTADRMFSGHTATYVLCGAFFFFAPPRACAAGFKWAVAVLVLLSAIASAATRDHYTVDVIVAIFITTLLACARRDTIRSCFADDAW